MHAPVKTRRSILSGIAGTAGLFLVDGCATAQAVRQAAADIALRIAPVELEAARGRTIHTVGYNGEVPAS